VLVALIPWVPGLPSIRVKGWGGEGQDRDNRLGVKCKCGPICKSANVCSFSSDKTQPHPDVPECPKTWHLDVLKDRSGLNT
jgi:hypothetical protein